MQKGGNGVEGQQCFCSPMPRSGSHESVTSMANENVEVDRSRAGGVGPNGNDVRGVFSLSKTD